MPEAALNVKSSGCVGTLCFILESLTALNTYFVTGGYSTGLSE